MDGKRPGARIAPGPRPSGSEPALAGRKSGKRLLDGDIGAGFGELGADGLRLVLGDAFLYLGGRGLDEVLRFLQAKAGDDFADRLDDVDLVVAEALEDDRELGLFLFGGAASPPLAATPAPGDIIIGAAAVMPNSSSIALFRSRSSRRVMPLMMSSASSTVAMCISSAQC